SPRSTATPWTARSSCPPRSSSGSPPERGLTRRGGDDGRGRRPATTRRRPPAASPPAAKRPPQRGSPERSLQRAVSMEISHSMIRTTATAVALLTVGTLVTVPSASAATAALPSCPLVFGHGG